MLINLIILQKFSIIIYDVFDRVILKSIDSYNSRKECKDEIELFLNSFNDKEKLLKVTKECLDRGIEKAIPGNRIGDIGNAVQDWAESNGYGVVRELVGHGIGTKLHEEPQIPNYGESGTGPLIDVGMCFAIEPMINMGTKDVYTKKDGWTICTKDGLPSAHFEHTITVTDNGPEILTK